MLKPPRSVTKSTPAPVSPGAAALSELAAFAPEPVKQSQPALAPIADTGTKGQSGASGSFEPTVEQTDFDITKADLWNALKKTPKTLGILTALAPSGVLSMVKAGTGILGGTPSEFSKTFKGGGTLSKIPIASLFLTKEGEAMGQSFVDTYKDLKYLTGGPEFEMEGNKRKVVNGKLVIKNADRITKALALGESPAPFIIEDFGNVSLAGSIANVGFRGALLKSAKDATKIGAFDEAPAATAAQAAAREAALAKMVKRSNTVQTVKGFTRATEKVAAAPMYPYIYGFRGAKYLTDYAGRAFADRLRAQADKLDAEGSTTNTASGLRRTADRANQFFGTPVRDEFGNAVLNDQGKPIIIQRPTVMQWAKDKLRRQETTTSEVQNAVVDTITKPPHFETDGEVKPYEQEAAFALRNGMAATIHFAMRAMPEIPLEEWRRMSNVNEHPNFHISLEGLRLALDFMENKVENPNTRDRVDFIVQATDQIIDTYISEPSRQGYGVDNPLDPYQDLPLPEIDRLRKALEAAGADDLVTIMDGLLENGLADLAIDDPVRTRWLAVLVEAAPDSVSGDASIWPATMRNRIEQVRAMRTWFEQKAAQTVMGTPPPEGGPHNFDPRTGDPNATGIPTVDDLLRNPQPGSLPRIPARFVNNALKSLKALNGKAKILGKNLTDIHIKIASYERNLLKLHYQLKEIEGMWVNNRGREVFPDKNGNLPKSAKRIPGALERAQELRDQLRAKYDEMVAAQQQNTVIDGKVVSLEEIQGNLGKMDELVDDMQTKVKGIDKSAQDLIDAKDALHNKSAQIAALMGLEGVDAGPIRAAIEEDMANLPEDLEQSTVFGPKYDVLNQMNDYVARVELVIENLAAEMAKAEKQLEFLEEQASVVEKAFEDEQITEKEYQDRMQSLDRSIQDAELKYNSIDELVDSANEYLDDARMAMNSKIADVIALMPEAEARNIAKVIEKTINDLEEQRSIEAANLEEIREFVVESNKAIKGFKNAIQIYDIYDKFVKDAVANPEARPVIVEFDAKRIKELFRTGRSGPGARSGVVPYAVIEFRGVKFELVSYGGGPRLKIKPVVFEDYLNQFTNWGTPDIDISGMEFLQNAATNPILSEEWGLTLENQIFVYLERAQRFVEGMGVEIGASKTDRTRASSVKEFYKDFKKEFSQLRLKHQEAKLADVPLQEAWNSVKSALADTKSRLTTAQENLGVAQKAIVDRISKIDKMKGRTNSADIKEAIAAFDIEQVIMGIDNAIDYYERTGNWYGQSLKVSSLYEKDGIDINTDAVVNAAGMELPQNPDNLTPREYYEEALRQRDIQQANLETALSKMDAAKLKTLAEISNPTPVKVDPLKEENWSRIGGDAYIDTGTRSYKSIEVVRGRSTRGKTLYDHHLQRIGSDGLPFENMTMVFKSFAAVRKYVAETVKTDAQVLGNLPEANFDRLALEGPKGLPFPKDLLDAEANLAKVKGKRATLLQTMQNTESKLTKLRVEESAKNVELQDKQARINNLEARVNREIITQPGLTKINDIEAPLDPATGNRLRPRVVAPAEIDSPSGQAVIASINEANMARAQSIPFTMPMRAAMEGRPDLTSGYDYAPSTRGFGYVPAGEMKARTKGATRTIDPGISGKQRLRMSHYRAGTSGEIYSLRELADRIVTARRGMDQNETIKFLMHSGFSTSPAALLGQELIDDLTRQAEEKAIRERDYAPGRVNRDFAFKDAVATNLGSLIDEQMVNRGWETNQGLTGDIKAGVYVNKVDGATRYLPTYMREAVASRTSYFNPAAVGAYLRWTKKATTVLKNAVLPFSLTWQIGDAIGILTSAHATDIPLGELAKNMKIAFEQNYGGGFTDIFRATENRQIGELGAFLGQSGLQDVGLATDRQQVLRGITPDEKIPLTQRIPGVRVPFKAWDTFKQSSYRLNEAINRVGRQAYFMTAFQKALDEYNAETNSSFTINDFPKHKLAVGTDPAGQKLSQAFWDTINQANDVLGDWLDLTPYERRVVLPHVTFYAWIKHINKFFMKVANDDPAKIMWHMYLGTMAYDDDFNIYDWLAQNPVGSILGGGVTNLAFASQWNDFFNGPLGSFVIDRDIRPAMRTLGPSPRLLSAATVGIDLTQLKEVSRPTGSGAYDQQGFQVNQGLLTNPFSAQRLGEFAGFGMQTFPLLKKVANLLPSADVPFTDIQTGPLKRFGTGATRTVPGTNIPVPEVGGRTNALLSLFNVPGREIMSAKQVQEMKIQQRLRLIENQQARLRYEIMKP